LLIDIIAGQTRRRTRMDDPWNAIHAFVTRHCPAEVTRFCPPAGEHHLRTAESALGVPLPADLAAWWRRCDGMEGNARLFPPLYIPYSVTEAMRSRDSWLRLSERLAGHTAGPHDPPVDGDQAGSPSYGRWLPQWLPIAFDGAGDELFVDLRPGPSRGCVGEFSHEAWQFTAPAWDSVGAMLDAIAGALRDDTHVRGMRIWADDEGISWDCDRDRWVFGATVIAPEVLRRRFDEFTAQLRTGTFCTPAGSWSAEEIAAHVLRTLELLVATTEQIAAGDPAGAERRLHAARMAGNWALHQQLAEEAAAVAATIRYDNTDTLNPATLNRYAARGIPALTQQIDQLTARLCEEIGPLRGGRPAAHAHIVDDGTTVIDGRVPWWGVLWALHMRQLPRRIRQLHGLRLPQ
jgi:cell wall assembly regulator SMI1